MVKLTHTKAWAGPPQPFHAWPPLRPDWLGIEAYPEVPVQALGHFLQPEKANTTETG